MLEGLAVVIIVYLAGWFVAVRRFARMHGPAPVPDRARREMRDAVFWPVWLALCALFWLIERRRQAFEAELPVD